MAVQETVVDHAPMPQAPVDESVRIPENVKRAAELANSFYQKPVEVPPEEAPPLAPEAPQDTNPPSTEASPEPVPPPEQTPAPTTQPSGGDWEHRYLSMQGRYNAAQKTIGSMQEQMRELGDELVRTQQLITRTAPQEQHTQQPVKLLTDADTETYGNEIIDLVKRAARETFEPELQKVQQENQQLRQRMSRDAQLSVVQTLDRDLPNWREINRNPRFKQWLSLRDLKARVVRKKLLDEAYAAADAPSVVSFFRDFVGDEVATGNMETTPQPQPSAQAPAPRQAAVPLESLAAPGRARPASGDNAMPADKPVFTRGQIQQFYANVRRGVYAGREVDKDKLERQIFSAQAEGRVRG